MSDEKKFVQGVFIREKEYKSGTGSYLLLNIDVDAFTKEMRARKNERGYASFGIAKSKKEKKDSLATTHYIFGFDDDNGSYKPSTNTSAVDIPDLDTPNTSMPLGTIPEEDNDLPF